MKKEKKMNKPIFKNEYRWKQLSKTYIKVSTKSMNKMGIVKSKKIRFLLDIYDIYFKLS